MHELSSLGSLKVAAWRPGRRVQIATSLSIGDIQIPSPETPRLLLVPENIAYLQQMWDSLRMPSRNNLLVTGESGSGKTTLIRYLGEIYRQVSLVGASELHDSHAATHARARAASFQTRILTFHENLRRSDITERRHYGEAGEDKTGWTMSDVMDGMVAGDWNILSEINRTGEDVQAEFNEPLENKAKSLHQRVIRGHPDSRFIATVNPVKSEGRGIYEGKVMSGEFINRFTNKVHLRYLSPDQEFEVLKSYGPGVDDQVVDRLIAIAGDIRRDYAEEHGVVPFPVTTRALIRMVRHLDRFPGDASLLRSLFWRKAYWLDERIHLPIARNLVGDLLDLHGITDGEHPFRERSCITSDMGDDHPHLRIGTVSHPTGPGGPYVPDTVIEEVQQNLADLEWIVKDIVLEENILLIGEAGVGKNKLESYLAHLLNHNLLVIGMSGETRVSDLLTYRSFGEEEAGKTGDTATLGLQALTDSVHGWMIVLDEANKAHPGVLVSFNDLLQDRLVRLPGGNVVPVRASIFVNINPNRPPYEVNDFSFEFMDRFSIHTILHLPADQAVEVLKKKYPGADADFVNDVVQGYYSLHPLYSSGMLFEPVTMRNEEAAIERGLQHPDRACNLIDLLTACYGPKDGRELHAIQGALQAAGFDRNVLAAAHALGQYRAIWEGDKGNEEKAVTLAETYRAIGKPSAARDVLREMRGRNPGRDWVFSLIDASILIDSNQADEAVRAIRSGFSEGTLLAMDNGEEYAVLSSDVRITACIPDISIEAKHIRTGDAALIVSLPAAPAPSLRRMSGEYSLTFSDRKHSLAIYERLASPVENPVIAPVPDEAGTQLVSSARLSDLVRDAVLLGGLMQGFRRQICRLPSPPWTEPDLVGGDLVRELVDGDSCIRLVAQWGAGWTITITGSGSGKGKAGWDPGKKEFFCTLREGGEFRVPVSEDPFLGLTYHGAFQTLFLILPDNLARAIGEDTGPGSTRADGLRLSVLSAGAYHSRVLAPMLDEVNPRLQRIFRYSRPIAGYGSPGSGDIIYTLEPGSGMSTAVLLEVDGFGPVCREISPGLHMDAASPPVALAGQDSVLERMIIPFPLLDDCEEWYALGSSHATQRHLNDIRQYAATTLLRTSQPRDIAFEAKARAILADYRQVAVPIGKETLLCRGDILVRNTPDRESPDLSRPVFIVQFLQEASGGGLKGSLPVVRGFYLGEPNPVATEDLSWIAGNFGRMIVEGDDLYDRIVRHLAAACQESARPFTFSRTGNPHDPFVKMEFGGFSLNYRPMERHFSFTVDQGEEASLLAIAETGYPIGTATASVGTCEAIRWQGLPLSDIRHVREREQLLVILDDDFLSALRNAGAIREDSGTTYGALEFCFIARSEAQGQGLGGYDA
jgi:MoxR-like ATPase